MTDDIFDILTAVEEIANDMATAEDSGDVAAVEIYKHELGALDIDPKEKIEALCLKYKNRQHLIEAIEAEADALTKRAKSLKRNNENLERFIGQLCDGRKFETARCKVTFRHNPPSVQILDESAIPEKYWKAGKPTISKSDIKDALENGAEVAGAVLVSKVTTSIK